MTWLRYLGQRSRTSIVLLGLLLTALLGVADYFTIPEITFSIFYLLPISLVAWFVGLKAGVLMSILAAILYLIDSVAGGSFSYATIPYWNSLTRLGFFFIVVLTLSTLRSTRDRREELMQFIIHDLRSPLTNVMTGLEIIHDDADERLGEEHKKFLDMCMVSCRRMLTLINSLLDLPRLEKRHMFIKTEPVAAEQLCTTALNQVRLWARQKEITFNENYPAGQVLVRADPAVTIRVLENILSNAIKFAPADSTISVGVYEPAPDSVEFTIQDEGEGIPEELSEKVFETYSQGDNPNSAAGTIGSGLGLTFSRYAIEAQRGQIWLERGSEKGTKVTFSLPKAYANADAATPT